MGNYMRKLLLIITCIFFLVFSSYNLSSKENYPKEKAVFFALGVGSFGKNSIKYKQDDSKTDQFGTTSKINLFFGYTFSKYFALETELGFGLPKTYKSNEIVHDIISNEYYLREITNKYYDQTTLLNLVGKYTFANMFSPFIKAGAGFAVHFNRYTYNSTTSNTLSKVESQLGLKISQGFTYKIAGGLDFNFNKNHTITLEYASVNTPNLSINYLADPTAEISSVADLITRVGGSFSYSIINLSYKFLF